MKQSVFPAVLTALVVSIFVHVVAGLLGDDGSSDLLARAEKAEERVQEVTSEMDVLIDRLDRLERRSSRARTVMPSEGGEAADAAPSDEAALRVDAEGRPLAPDGTPYVSRTELDEAVAKAVAARGGKIDTTPPEPAKTLAEVAQEMGLTAGEEAQIRNIMQESEDEILDIFFPGQKFADIKATVQEVADDPDRQADFVQEMAMKAVPNFGRLATLESRRKNKIRNVLGPERYRTFRSKRVKPFYGDEMENLFDGVLDDR